MSRRSLVKGNEVAGYEGGPSESMLDDQPHATREWAAVAAMSSQDRTRKNSGNQAYNELNTVIQVAPFPVKCVEVWQVVNLGK